MDQAGQTSTLIGTDVDWLAPGFQAVDVACLVPSCASADFAPAIADICARHRIDVVLPLIDPELPVLAQHRSLITATGAKLAVATESAVAIAADKWAVHDFFSELDLPSPRSWLPTQIDDIEDQEFPVFIKPRGGSAAADTFQVANRAQLDFFIDYVPNPIIQELLDGPEITTDVVCDFDGRPLAIVSRQRIAVRGGEAIKSVTIANDPVREACQRIATELPARGPITVQCMLKNGIPHFIEINARLGGGLPLAIAAGVDVPQLIQRATLGTVDGTPSLAQYQIGLHMTRCDESFFIKESFRDRIEGDHFRSR
jgi:carbamoyl-phosphate synthase large subunit